MNLFSSKSSRLRRSPSKVLPNAQPAGPSPAETSSVSQSSVGPLQTSGNLTSASDVPLDEIHGHINDPSIYAPTPSLIHSTEKETWRTSDTPASLDATTLQRDNKRVSAPEHHRGTLFTPQDAIIAHVFGRSVQPTTSPAYATPPPPSDALEPFVSMTSDSVPAPPSIQASHGGLPPLTVYEPFSGAMLGEHTPMSPSTETQGELPASAPLPTSDDRKLWSSLERILELQAEIAAMHADMEGVGRAQGNNTHTGGIASVGTGEGGNARSRKGLARGQTLPIGDEEPEEHEPEGGTTGRAVSEISTEHSDGGVDDEDDEDEDGIHGYGKKRRDEEFSRLAEQFTQRKAAIGGIMNKLDALSTALKTFHTLPPPLFDLATLPSRADTLSPAPSSVSAVSSIPPLHLHPGRPPSLRSSVSPFRAGNPVTPLAAFPSPPVPPISTLAPPMSSGHLSASRVFAPVLPQVALPTIIPGAPHVESPADMHRAPSTFPELS